jgi:hypothetical protein
MNNSNQGSFGYPDAPQDLVEKITKLTENC